jgi:hypothetical protein
MGPGTDFLRLERIESIHEVRSRLATHELGPEYCIVAVGRVEHRRARL